MNVSAIMPTRGRPEFALQALECFLAQDYPEKELIILDDADDLSFPNGIDHPQIRYFVEPRVSISEKRNRCCELAGGDVIAHFDSDDWSAPERLSRQIELMEQERRAVTGFHSVLFFEPANGQVTKYQGHRDYALGTSLVYLKSFWVTHRFPMNLRNQWGEDNAFVTAAATVGELVSVDGAGLIVARVHPGNMNKKLTDQYRKMRTEDLPRGFAA